MQVNIRNETTDRSTDLIVPVSTELTMYDGIYNHESVKTANVRKFSRKMTHTTSKTPMKKDKERKLLF